MFGLSKREQRWAAEQKAAETLLPFLATLSRDKAEISRLQNRIVALEAVNKALETAEANIILSLRKTLSVALDEIDRLEELSVNKILIAVVPDSDGNPQEVYAKSVKEVEEMLTELDTELEDWQIGVRVLTMTNHE